jgi:di/tricarboxylate transporter
MESATAGARPVRTDRRSEQSWARRLSTETKQAFKTTEFWAFVAMAVAILVSAASIKGGDTAPGTDEFVAKQAWLYVAILTGAYMISRGLAKSGSREPYDEDKDRDRD